MALQTLLNVFESLGLPVAQSKLEGLTSRLTFLGFELDTVVLEVGI